MMRKFIFIYTTFPTKKEAEKTARMLIKERLAACCNIFRINSMFFWKGKVERAGEFGVFIKTKRSLYPEIEKRLKELHPYSLPCIVSFELSFSFKPFLDWIEKSTKRK